ncbi:uncharacterized protein FOBCDRAFT_204269 [Fusarium oxysporum Fo47]|uniref:uncharacterized protein n=1 Tax=Fusarium oxysporum Fo47 TaxID=660027 RepID=UPI0028699EB9|nr:uncharacterized protein FOBCDRAFT_204269 [Fusarium oxysporum Fo47]QKD57304.2 hypothetical protein FOBCDRAFT_204269 [Fusarium oxysporum Fo47]
MALPNTPFFPQNLASQETQTQTSRHLEKLNRDGEKTQIPVALHLTNGSFIHGGAKHQVAIEQWSIGDEPFNTVIHIKILTLRNIGIPDVATLMGITKSAIAASPVGEYFQILCGSLHLCILETDPLTVTCFLRSVQEQFPRVKWMQFHDQARVRLTKLATSRISKTIGRRHLYSGIRSNSPKPLWFLSAIKF